MQGPRRGLRPDGREIASGHARVNIIYLMRHTVRPRPCRCRGTDGLAPRPSRAARGPSVRLWNPNQSGGIFSRYGPKNGISQNSPKSAFTKPITDRNNAVR